MIVIIVYANQRTIFRHYGLNQHVVIPAFPATVSSSKAM